MRIGTQGIERKRLELEVEQPLRARGPEALWPTDDHRHFNVGIVQLALGRWQAVVVILRTDLDGRIGQAVGAVDGDPGLRAGAHNRQVLFW